ncbi:ribulose-phosphate 3-epimerase [Nitrospinota bacterium]
MNPGTIRVAPSLLACRFEAMAEEIEAVQAAGADWLHFDVMDGHFVPNISVGPMGVEAARRAAPDMPLDVHLMISDPDSYLEAFAGAGADILTVHVEAPRHVHRTLEKIRSLGLGAGVTLNPGTPLGAVEAVLGDVDMALVMSVNPGFAGQKFIPGSLDRIRALREMIDHKGLAVLLEVDGGVNAQNASQVRRAGAEVLVAGSAVFGADDYADAICGIRGEG